MNDVMSLKQTIWHILGLSARATQLLYEITAPGTLVLSNFRAC